MSSSHGIGFATKWLRIRLYVASTILVAAAVWLVVYAFRLQVLDGRKYRLMADDQQTQEIELSPHRGRILDRNGAEFAISVEAESIYANQRQIGANALPFAESLADTLELSRDELQARLTGRRYFSWLKRRVSPEEARQVRELDLRGVYITREPRRFYPHKGLAGSVLGWAGVDGVGQEGLELQYERWLRGKSTKVAGLRDALGRPVLHQGIDDPAEATGHDLITTIDRTIQFHVEKALYRAVVTHHARSGVAVALDIANGEVVAMASSPSVNPNAPESGLRNLAVTDLFEPGSTMKTFTLAAALEAGAIGMDDRWFCENGKYKIGPVTIHDAEEIGSASTTEVLAKSSNICTAKIAMRVGKDRLTEMFTRFGFGKPTGIDLPGERTGLLRVPQKMGVIDLVTNAFGQGITVTPLQVAAAYAAIANDGVWIRPHILRQIVDGRGEPVLTTQVHGKRIISSTIALKLKRMLFAVTQPGGTAEKLSLKGYSFAGKTGTAQKVDPNTHRYSDDRWASSFVAFAPLEHPRLVLFVMIDEPQGTHYGSMVAGPVFVEAVASALRWWGVPDKVKTPTSYAMLAPMKTDVQKDLQMAENESLADQEQETALSSSDGLSVPDFTGHSMAEVLNTARAIGINVRLAGTGYATAQTPGPGRIRPNTVCQVFFSPVH